MNSSLLSKRFRSSDCSDVRARPKNKNWKKREGRGKDLPPPLHTSFFAPVPTFQTNSRANACCTCSEGIQGQKYLMQIKKILHIYRLHNFLWFVFFSDSKKGERTKVALFVPKKKNPHSLILSFCRRATSSPELFPYKMDAALGTRLADRLRRK